MRMGTVFRILVAIFVFATTNTSEAFLGSMDCPEESKTCYFSRGHYRFNTGQAGPDQKHFKVYEITKDYATAFDITFIVKNIKNLDPTQTMLTVGVRDVGPGDEFQYRSVGSLRDKVFHYQDVTMARIALLSFQEGVTVDVYYFMDCGFKMRQFARIDYPEQAHFAVPILKMLGAFAARQIVETTTEKTCWFVIPKDGRSGTGLIQKTYLLLNNASLTAPSKLKVVNVLSGKTLLSYPDASFNNDIAVSEDNLNKNVSVETGATKSVTTAMFFVDLICTTPWNSHCRRGSKFTVIFKPLSKADTNCLRAEDYCKLGFGIRSSHNPMCNPQERISTDALLPSTIASTSCPGVNDLLNAFSISWMHQTLLTQLTGGAIAPQSERRMGTLGKCSHLTTYCASIRTCSRQGGCGYICLMCHVRGICDSVAQYYPIYNAEQVLLD